MKNKQICPWCGEELLLKEIDEIYKHKTRFQRRTSVEYKKCCLCQKTIFSKIQYVSFIMLRWVCLIIIEPFAIIFTIAALLCKYIDSFASFPLIEITNSWVAISIPSLFITGIPDIYLAKSKRYRQYYVAENGNYKPLKHKPIVTASMEFSASIPVKQRKKEFVKDNILQICANGEKEYIILTKADFETGKCEATFPALKKENGLALLEKYSEFELSNGEEIIGILKVEKIFE